MNTTNGDTAFVICGIEPGAKNLENVPFQARYVQFNLYRFTIKTWNLEIDSLFFAAIEWVLNPNTKIESRAKQGRPKNFDLNQNYPNPFNPSTTIAFEIPESGYANLVIYNLSGKVVVTLVDEYTLAGSHKLTFDAIDLESGVYFYKLKTDYFS